MVPVAQVRSPSDRIEMPRAARTAPRQHAADEAAVKGHAALPQLNCFERMLEESDGL